MGKNNLRLGFVLIVAGILVASTILGVYVLSQASSTNIQLKTFKSYKELENFVKLRLEEAKKEEKFHIFVEKFLSVPILNIRKTLTSATLETSGGLEYSSTNIQVEGVDEADIVKTDGRYIYTISGKEIFIVEAYPPEKLRIVTKIDVNGGLLGLFINKDRLIVFKHEQLPAKPLENIKSMVISPPYWFYGVSVEIYDLSNIYNPVLTRKISLDGRYVSSRMIGDYVYVIVTQPLFLPLTKNFEVYHPKIIVDNTVEEILPRNIYYSDKVKIPKSYTTIVAINIFDKDKKPECKVILTGHTTCIYVSLNNIYVAIPKWNSLPNGESTEIHRIKIDGLEIKYEANGEVPGRILNQFSMDEYDGYFRVATTTGHVSRFQIQATSSNNVYVLNTETLKIVGKLEGLAPGEKIYSARFMGNRCYLVTFRKVDPLFTIDLTNPKNPKILGKLKIPGYSNYLHPYDKDHLIGIGKETVPAEEGDFSWYQGVKISLFDVSDVTNPKELDKIIIGDRGTETPVLRDHHALLFDKKRNLLVIPILEAKIFPEKYSGKIPPWVHGEYIFQGVYVLHVSLEEGIKLKGKITHLENQENLLKSGYYFKSKYEIKRSLYIDNMLYTVSDGKIKINNIKTLESLGEIRLD
ncbi:hypothetical protein CW703_06785 [Candidatus Bathyarchaeota archaeon]|nr:MAG: hypothetical protein CW703_06785 [Candidatus Bathyarchaeota archaeon]